VKVANLIYDFIKRCFDLLLVFLTAFPLAIIAMIVAVAVKMTSKGPALYWSRRIGQYGQEFKMPKFRTMLTDAPQLATHLMIEPERWLTPIGSFLRKSSLDELPQLYSVLIGDMSLVGPRPALFNQHDLMEARTKAGVQILKPGITGWAQVNGRDELEIKDKVELDVQYLAARSVTLDFKILAMTLVNVLRRKNVAH
jgi:O-antigen biosynthesis protein WbqP